MRHCTLFFLFVLSLSSTLFSQENLLLDGQLIYEDSDLSDIWGWEKDGREYAIVGKQYGISVVDVTAGEIAEELYSIPGSFSVWRDIKTYNNHAYIVDDQAGEGLIIIDLNDAPNSFTHTVWHAETIDYRSTECHNIYIEEATGYAYLLGCNNTLPDGVTYDLTIVLDLKVDPKLPVISGLYTERYVHDAYVRNDTMYTAEIDEGNFSIVDFTNKQDPLVLARQETSGGGTHNCWLSDDGNLLFTTDEVAEGFVDVYDISDFSDIQLLDKIQPSPGLQVIPHNAFLLDNWLITSWYTEGVIIHDISDPENLIEVGHFDTAPDFSGIGFDGAWGVYPYLPSGRVLVSDIQTGLWVLEPNYVEAARVKVNVKDQETGLPISEAVVLVETIDLQGTTNVFGEVEIGGGTAGLFTVNVGASGYETQRIENLEFISGEKTEIDIELIKSQPIELSFLVIDQGLTVNNASIRLESFTDSFQGKTGAGGGLTLPDVPSNTYTYYVGRWGYETEVIQQTYLGAEDNSLIILELHDRIYEDDFVLDLGWQLIEENSDGNWEVGVPGGTDVDGVPANPAVDIQGDNGEGCLVTGAEAGAVNGQNEIDEGTPSVVRSPVFNLSDMDDPVISFYRWFADLKTGAPNDTLFIELSNGQETILLDSCTANNPLASQWAYREFSVGDYIEPSNQMTLTLTIKDHAGSNVLEGGLDVFRAYDRNATFDLSGVIKDETSALLEEAFIALTHLDSGDSFSSFSEADGSYRVDGLTGGDYSIVVSKSNFSSVELASVEFSPIDDRKDFTLAQVVALQELSKAPQVRVHPNPFDALIRIEMDVADPTFQTEIIDTRVFDLDGQILHHSKGFQSLIDSSTWGKGLYILELRTVNHEQMRTRILKM